MDIYHTDPQINFCFILIPNYIDHLVFIFLIKNLVQRVILMT